MDTRPDVVDMWDERSTMGALAGTNDLPAKQLEMQTLLSCFPQGCTETVVDMGCGNGLTACYLKSQRPGMTMIGVDNSEGMINSAQGRTAIQKQDITYQLGSVLDWVPSRPVDCIYTERTLVNLPDWPSQRAAIMHILQMLKPGGTYLMMENSQDGVDQINTYRAHVGLGPVVPPWHNRYLRNIEIREIEKTPHGHLDHVIDYSSTYYFLSRVVNAWLAKQEGKDPEYTSPINDLGTRLPPLPLMMGQGRLWVWRSA